MSDKLLNKKMMERTVKNTALNFTILTKINKNFTFRMDLLNKMQTILSNKENNKTRRIYLLLSIN